MMHELMEHDWIAIGMAVVGIVMSIASIALTLAAEKRARRNRS